MSSPLLKNLAEKVLKPNSVSFSAMLPSISYRFLTSIFLIALSGKSHLQNNSVWF